MVPARCCAPCLSRAGSRSVLRRHFRMAGKAALGALHARLQRLGRWVVLPLGIGPSVRVREPFAVLFDERPRFQCIGDVHEVRRLGIPFERPLDLRDLGALGKKLAVAWNAAPIGFDHRVICRDYLDAMLGLAHGNGLPVVVSSEVGKREPIRDLQRVSVLLIMGQGDRGQAKLGPFACLKFGTTARHECVARAWSTRTQVGATGSRSNLKLAARRLPST